MQKKIEQYAQMPFSGSTSLQLASVVSAHCGEALEIVLLGADAPYRVVAHSAETSCIQENDQVLVLLMETGAIVTHRLRRPGELPQQGFQVHNDGSLTIENANGIMIKASNAQIAIDKTGRIFVDGKEIYSIANGLHRLQGTTIELN